MDKRHASKRSIESPRVCIPGRHLILVHCRLHAGRVHPLHIRCRCTRLVLRRGSRRIEHPGTAGPASQVVVDEPTLVFHPRAVQHVSRAPVSLPWLVSHDGRGKRQMHKEVHPRRWELLGGAATPCFPLGTGRCAQLVQDRLVLALAPGGGASPAESASITPTSGLAEIDPAAGTLWRGATSSQSSEECLEREVSPPAELNFRASIGTCRTQETNA